MPDCFQVLQQLHSSSNMSQLHQGHYEPQKYHETYYINTEGYL